VCRSAPLEQLVVPSGEEVDIVTSIRQRVGELGGVVEKPSVSGGLQDGESHATRLDFE
jgi:hypothetical protein